MKKLTSKQTQNFARIQAGIVLLNCSGTEFEDSLLFEGDEERLYKEMMKYPKALLKKNEFGLSSTNDVLNYVIAKF